MSLLYCLVCSLQSCDYLLGKADLLAIFLCLSLSHMVSRVRCGSLLHRFLIFAFFFTFNHLYFVSVLGMTSIAGGAYKRVSTRTKTYKRVSHKDTKIVYMKILIESTSFISNRLLL